MTKSDKTNPANVTDAYQEGYDHGFERGLKQGRKSKKGTPEPVEWRTISEIIRQRDEGAYPQELINLINEHHEAGQIEGYGAGRSYGQIEGLFQANLAASKGFNEVSRQNLDQLKRLEADGLDPSSFDQPEDPQVPDAPQESTDAYDIAPASEVITLLDEDTGEPVDFLPEDVVQEDDGAWVDA